MLDPATLAAVRERIATYRGAVSYDLSGIAAYDLARNDFLRMIADMQKASTMPPTENMDTRAAPALTADDVRRIAVKVYTDMRLAEAADNPPPPAQPAAAKRVEAWMDPVTGCVSLIDPGATSGWVYLTTFPGVTDAASAERMMAAMREAHRLFATIIGQTTTWNLCDTRKAADALAPFLPVPTDG